VYDGLDQARERILLVTFAATRITHLNSKLEQAATRGIPLRLVLEFSEASQGQLSFDAARAFSAAVKQHADIYCWATHHRLRNKQGNPAKLHAKFAVIDDRAYISSANLTGDAFERNIELGVVMFDKQRADELWKLVDGLVARGVFQMVR
jgi:phosphatidylserine/phosphatidylglycerophosphate/cardiolipin synthase-like enzyme